MHPDFDPQPTLTDGRLTLRPLVAADLEPLYAVASDPLIWEVHPAHDRHERAVFEPYFAALLATRATLAVTLLDTGQIIGCSQYYAAPDQPNSVSIGFTFLGRNWWGGPTNLAMKTLMFDHAFACVDTVWLHINLTNYRSQRATAKLGALHNYDAELVIGGTTATFQCWRMDRTKWHDRSQRRRPT